MTTYDTRNIKISVPSIYASRAELFTLYTAIMQLAIEGNLWTREARAIFDALATGAGLMIDAPPASVVSGAYTEIDQLVNLIIAAAVEEMKSDEQRNEN